MRRGQDKMRIALGCDHAAVEMAGMIKNFLQEKGAEVVCFIPPLGESVDYPVYARLAANAVLKDGCKGAVLICGTGAGISMAANKVPGIRAACCSEAVTARLSKEHNNANVICFGARIVGAETAKAIVDAWLDAEFQGDRHLTRVNMIEDTND